MKPARGYWPPCGAGTTERARVRLNVPNHSNADPLLAQACSVAPMSAVGLEHDTRYQAGSTTKSAFDPGTCVNSALAPVDDGLRDLT